MINTNNYLIYQCLSSFLVYPRLSVFQKCHAKNNLQYFESYAIIPPVATYLANAGD